MVLICCEAAVDWRDRRLKKVGGNDGQAHEGTCLYDAYGCLESIWLRDTGRLLGVTWM